MDLPFPSQTPGPCALPHEGVCEIRYRSGQCMSGSSCICPRFPSIPPTPAPEIPPCGLHRKTGWPQGLHYRGGIFIPRCAVTEATISTGLSSSPPFMFSFPLMLLFYQRQISRPGHLTAIRKGAIFLYHP